MYPNPKPKTTMNTKLKAMTDGPVVVGWHLVLKATRLAKLLLQGNLGDSVEFKVWDLGLHSWITKGGLCPFFLKMMPNLRNLDPQGV